MPDSLNRVLIGLPDRHAKAMEAIRVLERRQKLIEGFIERYNEEGRQTPRSTLVLIEDAINGHYDEPKAKHLDGTQEAEAYSSGGRAESGRTSSEPGQSPSSSDSEPEGETGRTGLDGHWTDETKARL